MPASCDVSVVLPVYNERDHVVAEIDRIKAALDASDYTYEIVVVDDCSTDGSNEVLQTVSGIRLITMPRNGGSGTVRRIGTRASRGDVVVWTDADMTYPNDLIPELVKELDGYDMIVGARTTEEGTIKALRVPAKWSIRKLAQYLSQTQIPDLNSGLRAFRRDVADQYLHLLPAGFSFDDLAANSNHFSLVRIEYRCGLRTPQTTRLGWRALEYRDRSRGPCHAALRGDLR